jgi:hypothetical protein
MTYQPASKQKHKTRRGYVAFGFAVLLTLLPHNAIAGGGSNFDQRIQDIWVERMRSMTAQLVAGGTYTIGMIGAMLDGMQTLDVQREMQRLQTIAIKDYMPGENLCRFGTLSRSLGASDATKQVTAITLNDLLLRRQTGNSYRIEPFADMDRISRLINLRTLYCNPGDNDKTPAACNCDVTAGTCTAGIGPLPSRFNRDLDFARLLATRLTLDINFSDYNQGTPANSQKGGLTADEQDLIGFLYNVSAPSAFDRYAQNDFSNKSHTAANSMMNERNIFALRSLVRNSLAQQIAKKVPGNPASRTYMINALRELGATDTEARRILQTEGLNLDRPGNAASGTVINPSYDAQMEVLTKKLYQSPNFYVNLVDKPTNIIRQQAAMKAIGLMQRRDIFETLLRREILLAALVELKTREETEAANARVKNAQANSGRNAE